MNMDYAVSEALKYASGFKQILLIYDVMCQYGKYLTKRLTEGSYLEIPNGLHIKKAIGLFHIMGHQDSCYPRYSPQFIEGAGVVDGEILESLWSPFDRIAPSTRTMTAASHQEMIDGHMNDSNFKKLIKIGNI
jgi:hypothetical protein